MTYPSGLDMANAVVATLNATANCRAYLGEAPATVTYPYVVVHAGPGMTDGTVGDRLRDMIQDLQTTCVGSTAEQALGLVDLVSSALDKVAPTVTGRSSHPMWMSTNPMPVRRDDSLINPVFFGVIGWRFRTSTP